MTLEKQALQVNPFTKLYCFYLKKICLFIHTFFWVFVFNVACNWPFSKQIFIFKQQQIQLFEQKMKTEKLAGWVSVILLIVFFLREINNERDLIGQIKL